MARAARPLSGISRNAQSGSGFFFDRDLRLRRHDYNVNIAGGLNAAQLTSDYIVADGIHLPSKRRAYYARPWAPADLGHADGFHRHQRGQLYVT